MHSEEKFHNISDQIEDISTRYFRELNDNVCSSHFDKHTQLTHCQDLDTIREELAALDPCFASIPISDTEESQNLRVAHAQRIISSSLSQNIWQPFSSEKTLHRPDFVSLLSEIAAELAKPRPDGSTSGRAASYWTALTNRALDSLSRNPPSPSTPTPPSSRPPAPRRADKAVDDSFRILFPLVTPSQEEQLRKELMALADSAIAVWNAAQTDELKITVSPTLNHANRNEWRYTKFDPPPSPSPTGRDVGEDVISSTYPRIFTLFPRILATQIVFPSREQPASLPGSYPQARDEPHATVTCVHSGFGLPEWSQLVLMGKEEEEERGAWVREEHERIKQAANARKVRRISGNSRRDSTGSVSGPVSPTSQHKRDGGMMRPVEE
jgi:hypothetical protein